MRPATSVSNTTSATVEPRRGAVTIQNFARRAITAGADSASAQSVSISSGATLRSWK